MKSIPGIILSLAFLTAGCATSYQPPQAAASALEVDVSGTAPEIFKRAAGALVAEGYSIASSDPDLGIISTQRRQMPLTPADADVGSTWGIDYLKDKRTTCYVTMTVQVSPGHAAIRAAIEAEYLPNDPSYGKRMTGVSRGTLERRIAERLQR